GRGPIGSAARQWSSEASKDGPNTIKQPDGKPMNRIASPLKQGAKGAAVADLQAALAFLGQSIPEAERAASRFGTGTAEQVAAFQSAQKLRASGAVDAATADALNKLLVEGS